MNKFIEETKELSISRMCKNLIFAVLASIIVISELYTSAHADECQDKAIMRTIPAMINTDSSLDEVCSSYEAARNLFQYEVISEVEVMNLSSAFELINTENYFIEEDSSEFIGGRDTIQEFDTEILEEINTYFCQYTDIASNNGVSAEMLDEASAYFQKYQTFENPFVGNGWVFIEAQEQSGIDALWLYAVSVYESGWGTSALAIEKGNYYGIGAWDTDISKAKSFNNTFYDGIVNGAIWIAENYYQQGYTTMIGMNSDPYHSYAPGNEIWIPTISDFINTFYYKWRV